MINFDDTPRPWLETQILAACTQSGHDGFPNEEFFWDMEVGHRLQCLVQIAALGEESGCLSIELRCPQTDCRLEMELDLDPAELLRIWQESDCQHTIHIQIGNKPIRFRHPRGSDQLSWLKRSFNSSREATLTMLETLTLEKCEHMPWAETIPDDTLLTTIVNTLSAADPRLNYNIRVVCPDCGHTECHYIDLGALALKRLRQAQDRLLDTIHCLASRYHWSEEQILAIPHWRRARYLALIQQEERRR